MSASEVHPAGRCNFVSPFDSGHDNRISPGSNIGTDNNTYLDSVGVVCGRRAVRCRALWQGSCGDTCSPCGNYLHCRFDLLCALLPAGQDCKLLGRHSPVSYGHIRVSGVPGYVGSFVSRQKLNGGKFPMDGSWIGTFININIYKNDIIFFYE